MALFRRHTADIATPLEVGVAHISLCGKLCAGINPASVNLNAPLPAAVNRLPNDSLLRWDNDQDASVELLAGWMDVVNTSLHQRYIFGHSVFRAALDAGARGFLPRSAAEFAAGELEMLLMSAIKDKNTDFVMMTGQAQLSQLGKMLGDYHIQSAAVAMLLLAHMHSPPKDEMDEQLGRALVDTKRPALITLIQRAREQKSHDASALEALDRYERIAEAAT